jgi:lysophospholipase L1-like esterase
MTASYVALGDSISIDDYAGGRGRGGASLLFRNRDDDFPDWRGRDLCSTDPTTTFALLATDGAKTATLLDVQLPRLAALQVAPSLVTLTIGGNDVLSAYGDTAAARLVIEQVQNAVSQALCWPPPVARARWPRRRRHGVRPERRHRGRRPARAARLA